VNPGVWQVAAVGKDIVPVEVDMAHVQIGSGGYRRNDLPHCVSKPAQMRNQKTMALRREGLRFLEKPWDPNIYPMEAVGKHALRVYRPLRPKFFMAGGRKEQLSPNYLKPAVTAQVQR